MNKERQQLKSFISKFSDRFEYLINNNDFAGVYATLMKLGDDSNVTDLPALMSEFTKLMHELNIDPLKHMDYIPYGYFYNSDTLNTVIIPKHIKSIHNSAFKFSSIQHLKFESGSQIDDIGFEAFSGCQHLESVELPKGLTYIEEYAFTNCMIQRLNLPESLQHIGYNAFANNNNLDSVKFPRYIGFVGSDVFEDCTNLKVINYPGSEWEWEENNYIPWEELPKGCTINFEG